MPSTGNASDRVAGRHARTGRIDWQRAGAGWRVGLISTHPAPPRCTGGCHDHVSGTGLLSHVIERRADAGSGSQLAGASEPGDVAGLGHHDQRGELPGPGSVRSTLTRGSALACWCSSQSIRSMTGARPSITARQPVTISRDALSLTSAATDRVMTGAAGDPRPWAPRRHGRRGGQTAGLMTV